MKIAMYVAAWPPGSHANGITTYADNLVPELRRAGHEVYILTFGSSDDYTVDLTQFMEKPQLLDRILYKSFPTVAHIRRLSRSIRKAVNYVIQAKGVEILEIEESFGLSRAVASDRLIPVVVRLHGPWFLTGNRNRGIEDKLRLRWESEAIKSADLVTAPSKIVIDEVKEYFRKKKYKAIDLTLVVNSLAGQQEYWSARCCKKHQLLFVGRFDALKGGDVVLKAFAEVANIHPHATLAFVGPDEGIDGKGFDEYAGATLRPDVRKRVTYFGSLTRHQINKLRLESFATISASRFEVFGYTVLEAMALGCPVIASAAGGTTELIRDGESGLLFEPGSHRQLVSCMLKLLEDEGFAHRIGKFARQQMPRYAPEAAAARTLRCYELALTKFRKKPQYT
jgi:glycosyltransferase involved in cell wall biosynthesis